MAVGFNGSSELPLLETLIRLDNLSDTSIYVFIISFIFPHVSCLYVTRLVSTNKIYS